MSCADDPISLLVDVSGTVMAVTASQQVPSGSSGLIMAGVGSDGIVRFINIDANTALKVTGSVTPTGAATEATLAEIEDELDTLVARTNTLGQKQMVASSPAVIASDQTPIAVGKVDSSNSTTTALLIGQTFTGSYTSTIGYSSIHLLLLTDVGGGGTVEGYPSIKWANDVSGNGEKKEDYLTLIFSDGDPFFPPGWVHLQIKIKAPYYKLIFRNGGPQNHSAFYLTSILSTEIADPSVQPNQSSGTLDSSLGSPRATLVAAYDIDGIARTFLINGEGSLIVDTLSMGAASEATLALIKAKTDNLDVALSTRAVTGLTDAQLRASAVPVSAASLPLPTGAATETTLAAMSAKLPAALVGGRLDENVGAWLGSTAPSVGQKAMAASLPVVIASDQTHLIADQGTAAAVGQAWPTKISDGAIVAALKAASTAAVATDQALVVAISPNNTVPISAASLPLPTGAATDAVLTGGTQKAITRGGAKGATAAADVTSTAEGADHQALDVQLYNGAAAINPQTIRALTATDVVSAEITKWIGSTAPTVGSKASTSSIPVVIASDQGAVAVSGPLTDTQFRASGSTLDILTTKINDGTRTAAVKAASTAAAATDPALVVAISPNNNLPTTVASAPTGTLSNVASSASSVTLLASNTARRGATVYNDSTQVCFVKFGTTASNTSFTIRLSAQDYYEVPFGYTGRIDGIWASANGNARVTEIT